MAYGKAKFGEVELELKATAATPLRFKQVFHFDLMKTFAKLDGIENMEASEQAEAGLDTSELISKLGFIMAKQAEKADFTKITIEAYYDWLDEFEPNCIPVEDIINIYVSNEQTTVEPKKEDAEPSGK